MPIFILWMIFIGCVNAESDRHEKSVVDIAALIVSGFVLCLAIPLCFVIFVHGKSYIDELIFN